jgi:hypothetical protein
MVRIRRGLSWQSRIFWSALRDERLRMDRGAAECVLVGPLRHETGSLGEVLCPRSKG